MGIFETSPVSYMEITAGVSMGKARCEPSWSWSVDCMPDYDLWYVLSGSGRIWINGIPYPIHAGCCFTLRPGDRIKAVQDLDNRLTVIFIHYLPLPADACNAAFNPPPRVVVDDTGHFESLLNRLLELNDTSHLWSESEFNWTMKLLLLELHRIERMAGNRDKNSYKHKQIVHKVIDLLRQNMGSRPDFEQLAHAVQLSPRYLSQLFKLYTGKSLKEYVTKLRMERARILLTETTMNITQVGEAVGYADLYVFSKLFKEINGVPPTHYRKITPPSTPH